MKMPRGAFLLMLVLILIMALALYLDYNRSRYGTFIYVGAFFALGIVSFFGFLFISRGARDPVVRLEDGDMRFAIAASFVTMFFAMLSFFLFSPLEPSAFARSFTDNFLTQTALIVGFYFATSGAIEYVKIRHAGVAGTVGDATATSTTTQTSTPPPSNE